jgi:hypothetical protein
MSAPWYAVYRNIDDGALEALANAGLLRRAAKDVEAGKVGWAEGVTPDGPDSASAGATGQGGTVLADGQRVQLTATGPRGARCDCPAPGMCKHILAASLWLRALPASEPGEAAAAPFDVVAEICSLPEAALLKAAGKAGRTQALAWLASCGVPEISIEAGSATIVLPGLQQQAIYIAGLGYDGMLSEAPAGSKRAVHLTALLAVRRAHGVQLQPAAMDGAVNAEAGGEAGALAAGEEGAGYAPGDGSSALTASERAFVAQLRELLHGILRNGLSHVSALVPPQLRALNMSARGEDMPRLAGMLRELGGTIDLLAERSYHADERQALSLMARIDALCVALEQADAAQLPGLRGKLRRDFKCATFPALLPLGGYWWTTRGGARGLTLSLWDPEARAIVQGVLARPDGSDPTFLRHTVWDVGTLWPGGGSPGSICQHMLRLEDARVADDGRIAFAGVKASCAPLWSPAQLEQAAPGYGDWQELREAVRDSGGLAGGTPDCVLLRPRDYAQPVLDEVRQQFEWRINDSHGRGLVLRVPAERAYEQRIGNLEKLAEKGLPIPLVLARIPRGEAAPALEPVALIVIENGKLRIVSLDFAKEHRLGNMGRFMRALAGMLESRSTPPALAAPGAIEGLLERASGALERITMSGRLPPDPGQRAELAALRQALQSVGLDLICDAMRRYEQHATPAHALQLYYVLMRCTSLVRAGRFGAAITT